MVYLSLLVPLLFSTLLLVLRNQVCLTVVDGSPLHAADQTCHDSLRAAYTLLQVGRVSALALCARVCTPLHALGDFGRVSAYPFLRVPLSLVELVFCSTPMRLYTLLRVCRSLFVVGLCYDFTRRCKILPEMPARIVPSARSCS